MKIIKITILRKQQHFIKITDDVQVVLLLLFGKLCRFTRTYAIPTFSGYTLYQNGFQAFQKLISRYFQQRFFHLCFDS